MLKFTNAHITPRIDNTEEVGLTTVREELQKFFLEIFMRNMH